MKNIALDFADSVGLALPALAPATVQQLQAKLPAYAVAENPLDYTTIGVRQPGLIGEIVHTMAADPNVGSVVLCIPVGPVIAQRDKAEHIVPALAACAKPAVLVLTGDDGPVESAFLDAIRAAGVPLFRSADRALRALARVAAYGDALARAERADAAGSAVAMPLPAAASAATSAATTAATATARNHIHAEWQGKTWLASLGIPVPRGALARTADDATRIARDVGWPVVLKAQASELPHKSDAGGVIVNLADETALRAAWSTLIANVARHKPGLVLDGALVEAMGPRGLELVVGARRGQGSDAGWGPVVLVGLGGVWIEALEDVRLIPADASEDDIVAELRRLKAAPLLAGTRGAAGVDLRAIAKVAATIGAQMRANPRIVEIDINPLVAYPDGVLALDALVVEGPPVATPEPRTFDAPTATASAARA